MEGIYFDHLYGTDWLIAILAV